jgi:biotin transporter BioY
MHVGAVPMVIFVFIVTWVAPQRQIMHVGDTHTAAYQAGRLLGFIAGAAVLGGLWLWMARKNKQGRPWARVVSTIFFGVFTVYLSLASLALFAGGESKAAVVAVLTLMLDWVIGLAALVFLWLNQSGQYYQACRSYNDAWK